MIWVGCWRNYYSKNNLGQWRMSLIGKYGHMQLWPSLSHLWYPTIPHSICLLHSWTPQSSKTGNRETEVYLQKNMEVKKKKKERPTKEFWAFYNYIVCNNNIAHYSKIIPNSDFHVKPMGRSVTLHIQVELYVVLP